MPTGHAVRQVLWYKYHPFAQTTQFSALLEQDRQDASAQGWHSRRVMLALVPGIVMVATEVNMEVGQLDQQ